jgi:putative glutamine amidotransferase
MNRKPRIGVTFSGEIKVEPYLNALQVHGAEAIPLAPNSLPSLHGFNALMLGGGVDLNPILYGQSKDPMTEEPNNERDLLEKSLLEQALAQDLPVLGICRGMQMFNVVHGGTLFQHLSHYRDHQVYLKDKSIPAHNILIKESSKLHAVLGTERAAVNSRHHQAVDRPGHGLVITALAEDGTVEALENPEKKFALAVQWHPEDQVPGDLLQQKLFHEFVAIARQ